MPSNPRTWFITGASRGFGRVWAEAALGRGDQVVATARDTSTLDALVEKFGDNVFPIALDVTNKAQIDAAVKDAHDHFGRLDIVVNNAGYGLFGVIEEITEELPRHQMETNFFGALFVTQAALPYLREQGSGHIIQVSSIGGVNAFPTLGMYHASKWALEGFSQSLWAEVYGLGIKVTIIEPGGFTTDWSGSSSVHAELNPAYDGVRAARAELFSHSRRGDPEATGPAILTVVDSDDPPLRIFFGKGGLWLTKAEYENRIALWEKWNDVGEAAFGEE